MHLLGEIRRTEPGECPYLPRRTCIQEYFFADEVADDEMEVLLSEGWREFSGYFFRPVCPECRECVPIRICADMLKPSKSQRRLIRKNSTVCVGFGPLRMTEEVFRVYQEHTKMRFGKEASEDELFFSLYGPPCSSLQTEYYVDSELAGVGYIDRSSKSLSSVYFVFAEKYRKLGLGNFSILAEALHAKKNGLSYYYLGYYIRENSHMAYKGRFYPHERYDWGEKVWVRFNGDVKFHAKV